MAASDIPGTLAAVAANARPASKATVAHVGHRLATWRRSVPKPSAAFGDFTDVVRGAALTSRKVATEGYACEGSDIQTRLTRTWCKGFLATRPGAKMSMLNRLLGKRLERLQRLGGFLGVL